MTKWGAFIIIFSVAASSCHADERIWLNAKINNKPAPLCFDSGSTANALTSQAAKKLGLKFIPAPTNNFNTGVLAGDTEDCVLTLDNIVTGTTSFLVLDVPSYLDAGCDGIIGWWSMSPNILQIDAVAGKVTVLPAMPKQATQWNQFSILALTNSGALDLQMPREGRTNGVLCIDTGSDFGFAMPNKEWKQWRESHHDVPITLKTDYTPSDGFYVTQEAWADEISIGPLVLRGLPIMRAGPFGAKRWGDQYEGTLGLAALKRMDIIVDGKNNLAYLRPKTSKPPAYRHNRLGAIFVPTGNHTNQAIARVVEDGPAYNAGVRNGDILLQVGVVKINGWTSDWLNQFLLPAGTKLDLTLERDGKTFNTTVILREIVHPNPSKAN